MFTTKLRGKYRDFTYFPCLQTCIDLSPIINIPHQTGTFVAIDEPTLIYLNHPKTIAYSRVHSFSGSCIFFLSFDI